MKTEEIIKDKIEKLKKHYEINKSFYDIDRTNKLNAEINALEWVLK